MRLPIPPPGLSGFCFLRCCTRLAALKQKILVPRRGLEPPRSYPLVPETSASTNSATWASQEAAILARIFRIFDSAEKSLKSSRGAVRCGAVPGCWCCCSLGCWAGSRVGIKRAGQTKNPADCEICRVSCLVPRRGLEPPRSYPLVPETSASANSATWAFRVLFLEICPKSSK